MRTTYILGAAMLAAGSFAGFPNFGPDSIFPQIGIVTNGSSFGSGTIITPNHVLTARHVGGVTFRTYANGLNLTQQFTAIGRVNHPTADISILTFAPNTFSSWIRPDYTGHIGDTATMVGFGLTALRRGDQSGWNHNNGSGIRRAAVNVIDGMVSAGSFGQALIYDLDDETDPGNNHYSGGGAIANEGGIASGDSGGAWLVSNRLVGVNSFVFDTTGNSGTSINTYLDDGDGGGAIAVSVYEQWIETNAPVPEPASMLVLGAGAAWLAARRRRRLA